MKKKNNTKQFVQPIQKVIAVHGKISSRHVNVTFAFDWMIICEGIIAVNFRIKILLSLSKINTFDILSANKIKYTFMFQHLRCSRDTMVSEVTTALYSKQNKIINLKSTVSNVSRVL